MDAVIYLTDERHTLASALRPVLEAAHPDAFVACTQAHPMDDFIEVRAPTPADVRAALLRVKDQVAAARRAADRAPARPGASAARA